MTCRLCRSGELSRFTGELAIHSPGLKDENQPVVWVCPELWVCLNCGSAEFSIPERQLFVLSLANANGPGLDQPDRLIAKSKERIG
jgi:hypothetical protein